MRETSKEAVICHCYLSCGGVKKEALDAHTNKATTTTKQAYSAVKHSKDIKKIIKE